MRLTIAYSKIKKQNLVLINYDTHQRETLSERPIQLPLSTVLYLKKYTQESRKEKPISIFLNSHLLIILPGLYYINIYKLLEMSMIHYS